MKSMLSVLNSYPAVVFIFVHQAIELSHLPPALLQSLQYIPGFDQQAFEQVHASGEQITSIRLNPFKQAKAEDLHLPVASTVPWSSHGYYLKERPSFTFDPVFHAGAYYVQEASSMFLEQALKQTVDLTQSLRVLDLCAAPGGKSTLLQSLISKESLLVSNDVIKSRAAILEENMIKWGAANVVVTNNDPAHFARLENYFDVVVIDAPCSGSGLFRRDPDAINEWSKNNVALCSQRQQRILADVWPALKQDGILIYSTCSYSQEEDEMILDWIGDQFTTESLQLKIDQEWNIIETISPQKNGYGYRFYPDKIKGEGFFITVLQKKHGGSFNYGKPGKSRVEKLTKTEESIVRPWLQQEDDSILFKQKDDIIILPAVFEKDIHVLQSALYIKKAGIMVGKLAGKDLIPDHAFAMSNMMSEQIPQIELTLPDAVRYLRREEFPLQSEKKGWVLINYTGHHLGWIKILPNRFNNYYPKEWRILKQSPEF